MEGTAQLKGKVAWVTGSSRGIGRAIAAHLAGLGASVAVHGSSAASPKAFGEADSLAAVAAEIARETGSRVIAVTGDLTDPAVVERLDGEITRTLGPIDILVNNAGGDIGAQGPTGPRAGKPEGNNPLDISLQDLRTVLDRNLMTCLLCCRQVGRAMRERRTGWVVNIGSISGLVGLEGASIYATAKAAVHEYTRCLAVHLRPYNVRVNAVAPGDTLTGRYAASRPTDPALMVEGGTLVRYGRSLEIARAVAFFCGEGASYLTGQVVRVDGGAQCWAG